MTGLDKILAKIEQESTAQAEAVLSDANQQAQQLLAEAQTAADEKAAALIERAQQEAKRKIGAAHASAETLTRTNYLSVRGAVVNDVIAAAYEAIEAMSDKEYFDLLYTLCVKNVEKSEGKLYLNRRDLARCPADFEDRINQTIYESGAVQVAKEPKDIENGFILVYGDMEVNCTLRAVFDEKMDVLKDRLNPLLFD